MARGAPFAAIAPWAFPVFFVGLWLTMTALLGSWSGWYALQARFPDEREPPIDRIGWQSGVLGAGSSFSPWGGVSYRGCLRFDVCRSGLRIAVWPIFGAFCRPFFVPWPAIAAEEKRLLFFRFYRLNFADSGGRALTIGRRAFDRISTTRRLSTR